MRLFSDRTIARLPSVQGLADADVDQALADAQAVYDHVIDAEDGVQGVDEAAVRRHFEDDLGPDRTTRALGLLGDMRRVVALHATPVDGPPPIPDRATMERTNVEDLRVLARAHKIEGASRMVKDDLIDALAGAA